MELGQLRHFLAVVQQGNFARAAEQCGVTQQALSASIGRLERNLETRLFDRGRTGAHPTAEAQVFAPFVDLAFTELQLGKQALQESGMGNIGELRFGIGQTFSGHIVPDAIVQMNQERPGVTITMFENYSPILAKQVIDGELDFFVGAPIEPLVSNSRLDVKPLFNVADQVVCRAAHPLADKKEVSAEEIMKYPWLFPSPPTEEEQCVIRACEKLGIAPPKMIVYSDTIATAQALLAHADYLLLGQPEVLAPLFEAGILTTVAVDIERPTRIAYIGVRHKEVLRPCVQRLVDIIEEKAALFEQKY